jgi:WD40 repeat protein/serine/threonine protein kinase
MAAVEVHPSVEELAAFTLGNLADEAQVSIETHVAGCASCQQRAALAPDDTLVELLRSAHAGISHGVDTPVLLPAGAQTEALPAAVAPSALAGWDHAEIPDTVPPELARHERYRVVRLLGAGGMGAVYEAEHRVMQRPVALKVIKRAYTANAGALDRFRREVRTAARLSHLNIVTTYDAEDAGDTHFLVMEYVEGTDLGRLVQERGAFPVDRACDYIRQAALGLQYAFEQGMVHRDLKPHNLMLTPDGRVKILDFGLARFASEAVAATELTDTGIAWGTINSIAPVLTGTGIVLGTVDYIAPEQAEGPHQADIRSDIYSLGCTLYHLLAGQPPYPTGTASEKLMAHVQKEPQTLTELCPDLPEGMMPVLERMMAKNPRDRFQTPVEVALALEPFTHPRERATDTSGTLVLEMTPARQRRRRQFTIAATVLGLLAAGLLGLGVYRIATDSGELVIRTNDDDVEVVVRKGGEVVKIIDTKSGKHVTLKSGDYELGLNGGRKGLKLSPNKINVKRGETVLATIEWVMPPNLIKTFDGDGKRVSAVAFFKDGRRFASCGYDRTIRLWEVATRQELKARRLQGHGHPDIDCLAISPDERYLLTGGYDSTLRLWDLQTREPLASFAHDNRVSSVAFSPDGLWALSGSHDHTLRLFDLKDRKEVHRFPGHTWPVQQVAISPDGRRAASASWDKTVRLWNLEKREEVACLREHTQPVDAVAFSSDGALLLTGARDRTVRVWDVQTGKELRRFEGHTLSVLSVTFSPDGRRALSASSDGTVRLWDVSTANQLHRFTGHQGIVRCVAFSPDGRSALSCGDDGSIRLWPLPPQ